MPAATKKKQELDTHATTDTMQESGPGAEQTASGGEALSGGAEAWEPWETRLVLWSLAIGGAGLLVLGWLVDRFILP